MPTTTRTADAFEQLREGVAGLASTDAWRRWLVAARTFHAYSFRNVLMLLAQMPDATSVAGFHAWRALGRQVRRGEKALWVLAPVTRRRSDADEDGTEEAPRRAVGFRAVPVFDVSQTEGDDLPQVATRLLGEDPTDAYARLVAVAGSLGYQVEDAELGGSTNGDCAFDLRRIRVRTSNSPAQRTKTLVHEIAHALCHEDASDRALAELEAESVAFIVCAKLDLDSSAYSFGYVAGWAAGTDEAVAAITASGARIQATAQAILAALGDDAGASS